MITRPYTQEDVKKLKGTLQIEYTIAHMMAAKLRSLLNTEHHIKALGCMTGMQAIQCAKAGLKSIYASGWQVAGDQNLSGETYPDQSLYPVNSMPALVRRINKALQRADQIQYAVNKYETNYWLPIVADGEAGFGGPLNVFELTKSLIEAGAAGIHFEDQLASAKRCGHLGGKVLVPASQFIKTLVAARLAADVMNVNTVIIARTDAQSAKLLTTDLDESDKQFITNKERSSDGFYEISGGLDMAISRGLAYAPYADLIWCETSVPSIADAKRFAEAIHNKYPHKMLAYNCSPSFNWKKYLPDNEILMFQDKLGDLGYKFQFVTLAGFHALNFGMFKLANNYRVLGMDAYVKLQSDEFNLEANGYTATRHQQEVGTGYFDLVMETIGSNLSAMKDSTEKEQFNA